MRKYILIGLLALSSIWFLISIIAPNTRTERLLGHVDTIADFDANISHLEFTSYNDKKIDFLVAKNKLNVSQGDYAYIYYKSKNDKNDVKKVKKVDDAIYFVELIQQPDLEIRNRIQNWLYNVESSLLNRIGSIILIVAFAYYLKNL